MIHKRVSATFFRSGIISSPFQHVRPDELGLCPARWQHVLTLADQLCQSGQLPGLSLQVQRQGNSTGIHCFGSRSLTEHIPVEPQTLFLVASLTKPMVALTILRLVEKGELGLNQRVVEFLPEFKAGPKRPITIRHLLTHTSGLPDMLPNNLELRRSHAPLSEFAAQTCQTELVFPPGRSAQYQSMGFALLAPIVARVTGSSLSEVMQREVFRPLGMTQSWLGLPDDMCDSPDIAEVDVPAAHRDGADWNWNSRYWRKLGAPWGGVIASTEDISRFCRACLDGGQDQTGSRLFSPSLLQEATSNRLHDFPAIPESERRTRSWGLGFRLNWKLHRSCYSDLLPDEVFGHWGATGTVFWMDAAHGFSAVLLSNRALPDNVSPLTRLSNAIAAAMIDCDSNASTELRR